MVQETENPEVTQEAPAERAQAEGYDALSFDVRIVEGQTVTYKGTLHKR